MSPRDGEGDAPETAESGVVENACGLFRQMPEQGYSASVAITARRVGRCQRTFARRSRDAPTRYARECAADGSRRQIMLRRPKRSADAERARELVKRTLAVGIMNVDEAAIAISWRAIEESSGRTAPAHPQAEDARRRLISGQCLTEARSPMHRQPPGCRGRAGGCPRACDNRPRVPARCRRPGSPELDARRQSAPR